MKSTSRTPFLIFLVVNFTLVSCTALRNTGRGSIAVVKNSSVAAMDKVSSLVSLLPGQDRIKVVEVREKDLKDLPTGHELAQARKSERGSGFWIFGGPVDFKEPTLPEPGPELDGSLLPPRIP